MSDSDKPELRFKKVMQACSDKGLKWDRKVIDENCIIKKRIRHPSRTIGKKNDRRMKADSEYHQSWVYSLHMDVCKVANVDCLLSVAAPRDN